MANDPYTNFNNLDDPHNSRGLPCSHLQEAHPEKPLNPRLAARRLSARSILTALGVLTTAAAVIVVARKASRPSSRGLGQ